MTDKHRLNLPQIKEEKSVDVSGYDGILLVASPSSPIKLSSELDYAVSRALKCDPSMETETTVLPLPELPAGRLVYAPTGPLDPDYDDVRSFQETAVKGVQRALKAGIRKLLVALEAYENYENSELVTLLGALEALYVPIQIREHHPSKAAKLELLGVVSHCSARTSSMVQLAKAFECGRYIARDIGGGDPERMTPSNVKNYVQEWFSKTSIKVSVIDSPCLLAKEYPLFEAVNRAANVIERHRGAIIFLEYDPPGDVKETLFLVGKGVTYDTGGADIKAGGVMAGMSRDKCGAAAVAGFMEIVDTLKPKNVRVVAAMSMVRNSVGENSYVSDELIMSRAKKLVRVGNTDAEGRMIMADVLCQMKEMALNAVNPHIFTIATLTGHAFLTVGNGYSIAMDNGPARKAGTAQRLQTRGHVLADPFEISTVRREDFAFHKGKTEGDDVMQSNSAPSVRTPRGHQGPAAFLMLASGLDKHGSGSEKPLKYSHLDIVGSAGEFPQAPTGAPIIALANTFLLNN